MQNHYEVLGFPKDGYLNGVRISEEVVRAQFKLKAMETHPDKGGDENVFKAINLAKEVLTDPEKRAEFDESLSKNPELLSASKHLFMDFDNADKEVHATPVSKELVATKTAQINLSELILNAKYSPKEVLALMKKNSKLAEGVFQTAALWGRFDPTQKMECLLSYYNQESNLQALEAIPALAILLKDLNRGRAYVGELVGLANQPEYRLQVESFIKENKGCLSVLSLKQKLSLAEHFLFVLGPILAMHHSELSFSEIRMLIQKHPNQKPQIMAALPHNMQEMVKHYDAAEAAIKRGEKVSKYFEAHPQSLSILRAEACNLCGTDSIENLCQRMSVLSYLCLILGEDILNDRLSESEIHIFSNYIISFMGLALWSKVPLKSDFYNNEIHRKIFSLTHYTNFPDLLSKIYTHGGGYDEDTLNYLSNFVFTYKVDGECYFYQLLEKSDNSVFTFFKNNQLLLLAFINSPQGCEFLGKNPIHLDAILSKSIEKHYIEALKPLLEEKGLYGSIAIKVKAMAEFEPFLQRKSEDKSAHMELDTFKRLYSITGFFPDLLFLNIQDASANLKLLSDALEHDNVTVEIKYFYSCTADFTPYQNKLFSVLAKIRSLAELDLLKKILRSSKGKLALLQLVKSEERGWKTLQNLAQHKDIVDQHLTGSILQIAIDKVLKYSSLAYSLPYNNEFADFRNKFSDCKTYKDLFALVDSVNLESFSAVANKGEKFPEIEALFNSLKSPWLRSKVEAYKKLTHFLDLLAVKNSKDVGDDDLVTLKTLIMQSGLDEETLKLVFEKIKPHTLLVNAICNLIEDKDIPGCTDEIKPLLAKAQSDRPDEEKSNYVFQSMAERYIKKNYTHLSGDELILLDDRFGAKLTPVIHTYNLENLLINAKQLYRVRGKLEGKDGTSNFSNREVTMDDVYSGALREFKNLLKDKPDAKDNDQQCKVFKARIAEQVRHYKNTDLEKLNAACSVEGNPLIWGISYSITVNDQFNDQVRQEFSTAAQEHSSIFAIYCYYIQKNLLQNTFTMEQLFHVLNLGAIQKMFDHWLQGEGGQVPDAAVQSWVKDTLDKDDGLELLAAKLGVERRDHLLRALMFSGERNIVRLQSLFGKNNTLPVLIILWPQGNLPSDIRNWLHTQLTASQIELENLATGQAHWVVKELASGEPYAQQLLNWTAKCIREQKGGLEVLATEIGAQARDKLLRAALQGDESIEHLRALFGEHAILPVIYTVWRVDCPADKRTWLHKQLNTLNIQLENLAHDQGHWIVTQLIAGEHYSEPLFNWAAKHIREEKNGLETLGREIGVQSRNQLLHAALKSHESLTHLEALFGEDAIVPIISKLWEGEEAKNTPVSVSLYLLDKFENDSAALQACLQIPSSAKTFVKEHKLGKFKSIINNNWLDFDALNKMNSFETGICAQLGDAVSLDKFQMFKSFLDSPYYLYLKENIFSEIDQEIQRLKDDAGSWIKENGSRKSNLLQQEKNAIEQQLASGIIEVLHGRTTLKKVHDGLENKIRTVSETSEIDASRSPLADFFKVLLGFILAAPLFFMPILNSSYNNLFFATQTKRKMHDLGEKLHEYKNSPAISGSTPEGSL